ncbi:S9 family peptidase [Sphingobium aquiterrae]|uniref:S9 family peptidase n=1 Tax=Sphingobium aquiterrae TaxID=2038656 RepID=UPI0030167A52
MAHALAGVSPVAASSVDVPASAALSADGLQAAWIKVDGTGLLLAKRSNTAGGWVSAGEFTIRGVVRSPQFSPDGKSVAFQNIRGGYPTTARYRGGPSFNWSYIAVYTIGGGEISYLDPSLAFDSDARWEAADTLSFTRRIGEEAGTRISRKVEPLVARASAGEQKKLNLLESLLSAPFSYQPARAADGRSLAFVAREGRSRTIYFARLEGKARSIVRYGGDDGLELSQVALSPDGNWLAYVRGGAPNAKGEIPNARSFPVPVEQQIWLVSTSGSAKAVPVSIGSQPQFSPDGSLLLWTTATGVAMAPLGKASGVGAVDYVSAGRAERIRISPDSKRIAFERSAHVEVVDLESRAQWVLEKPSIATDSHATWSPDGTALAVVRTFGETPATGIAKRPWEIVAADAATRTTRTVWRAEPGVGSAFFPLDQDQSKNGVEWEQLLWSASGEIAFAWEQGGWRRLYAVPAAGGAARLLTPGEGEVEAAAVSLDGKSIIYSTNIGDRASRRMWSVPFGGGVPQPASVATANQWGPTPMADGAIAMVQSDHSVPPAVVLRDAKGRTRSLGGPELASAFPAKRMVRPQPVSFAAPDGMPISGELFVPAKPNGCGVIFIHGGSRRQMLLGFHYIDVYANLYELNQYFAMQGCAVLSVEYRTGIMLGHAFRNAPARGEMGASEYQDVLAGLTYLRSRPELNVKQVGIYGLSYGGLLTAQALARDPDKFAVGFDMAGVHTYPGEGFQHAPLAFVDKWNTPVYFASGDDDRNVDHSHSILLYNEIRKRRPALDVVAEAFPNEVHDLYLTMDDLVKVYWNGSSFMLKYLLSAE